jgi:soluble lytic murein transglycosylase
VIHDCLRETFPSFAFHTGTATSHPARNRGAPWNCAFRLVNPVSTESSVGFTPLPASNFDYVRRRCVYGNPPTNVNRVHPLRLGVGLLLICSLVASSAAAQSKGLLEAVRIQAPNLAARAHAELMACATRTDTCADQARLSLLAGVLWLSEGDAQRAATQLNAVKPPKKLEAFHAWYLGEAQAWSGARASAINTLTKAKLKAPPTLSRRIEVRIAELQLDLGQASKARPVLEAVASETPTPEALLSRAYARLATNAKREAQKDLRTLLLRFPTHPHSAEAMRLLSVDGAPTFTFEEQLMRSEGLIAHGAPSEALHQLDAARPGEGKEHAASEARVALLRAQAFLLMGRDADAEFQLEIASARGKPATAAEAMMTKARRLMRAQKHADARAIMLALNKTHPDNGNAPEAAYLGSWLSLTDGKYNQAIADFDWFDAHHTNSKKRDEGRWFRAWAFFRLGRFEEARNSLRALVQAFPSSSLTAQASYWATRMAQLGKLSQHKLKVPMNDGGDAASVRTTGPDVPINIVQEYRDVVRVFSGTFYAVLATERLRELNQPVPRIFAERPRGLTTTPPASLTLAIELWRCGLLKDATDEVNRVIGTVGSAEDALVMGHALHSVGEFGPAHGLAARWLWGQVYTAKKPEAIALMYPLAYQQTVETNAAKVGLDPFLAWAIMRRESGFRPEVVSTADARGLMQIIPQTARAIAQELKATPPAPDDLFAPENNVRFGTWYLSALMERMGHPALGAASYNAGPSAVSKWMAQRGHLPMDEWIEEIPYKETRVYVKQVLADYVIYQQLYSEGEASPLLLSLPSPRTSGVAF